MTTPLCFCQFAAAVFPFPSFPPSLTPHNTHPISAKNYKYNLFQKQLGRMKLRFILRVTQHKTNFSTKPKVQSMQNHNQGERNAVPSSGSRNTKPVVTQNYKHDFRSQGHTAPNQFLLETLSVTSLYHISLSNPDRCKYLFRQNFSRIYPSSLTNPNAIKTTPATQLILLSKRSEKCLPSFHPICAAVKFITSAIHKINQ